MTEPEQQDMPPEVIRAQYLLDIAYFMTEVIDANSDSDAIRKLATERLANPVAGHLTAALSIAMSLGDYFRIPRHVVREALAEVMASAVKEIAVWALRTGRVEAIFSSGQNPASANATHPAPSSPNTQSSNPPSNPPMRTGPYIWPFSVD